MSVELLEKTKKVILWLKELKEPHEIIKTLIDLNKTIDCVFDSVIKDNSILDKVEELLSEFKKFSLTHYLHKEQEVHNVRGNIIASINSLVSITESKMLLLINDEEWCDLDNYYRSKSEFFNKEDMFNIGLFLENEINYTNNHPLVQFSMMQCKETLFDILLSRKRYENVQDLKFLQTLYDLVRCRVAIISNYAHSQDVNDIDEYVVCINNHRAIPTSKFIYDFGMLCKEVERNFFLFQHFYSIQPTEEYTDYLTQIRTTFLKWVANMTVTAAGDDFCAIFGKYYCEAHVCYFEEILYRRKFPNVRIIFYKLLQITRGMKIANEIMQTGNDFVVDLLKRENIDDDDDDEAELDLDDPDGMCDSTVVLERMGKLSVSDLNILVMGLCNYVTTRQWNRSIGSFFTRTHNPDVSLEPVLLRIPFSHNIILFTKSQKPVAFKTFVAAFSAWCYHLQRDYEGLLYDRKTNEKTICTSQLKKMFAL